MESDLTGGECAEQNGADATVPFDELHLLEEIREQLGDKLAEFQVAVDLPKFTGVEIDLQLMAECSLHFSFLLPLFAIIRKAKALDLESVEDNEAKPVTLIEVLTPCTLFIGIK